jgi:uncharacterized protein (DUF427 family)
MYQAVWKGAVLAEAKSAECRILADHIYFPPQSIKKDYFRHSVKHTRSPELGAAAYYDVVVDEEVNPAAAWYYSAPTEVAEHVKFYLAFERGVDIVSRPD